MRDITSECRVEKLANGLLRVWHLPSRAALLCNADGTARSGDVTIRDGRVYLRLSVVRIDRA